MRHNSARTSMKSLFLDHERKTYNIGDRVMEGFEFSEEPLSVDVTAENQFNFATTG